MQQQQEQLPQLKFQFLFFKCHG